MPEKLTVIHKMPVMPVEAGIQRLKSLDSGQKHAGMAIEWDGRDWHPYLRMLTAALLVMLLMSCSKHLPLPEVDLSAPGWTVWTGQALWKPEADRAAIAGDIVLARHDNGDVLISFAKPPVPVFTARTSAKIWSIDYVYAQRAHTGSGRPPSRFVWFQIPALIQDAATPKGWRMRAEADSVWELHNPDSGEHIRLVLDQ